MKANVANYIYDKYAERGVKAFESKVKALLEENGIYGDVICHNAWMQHSGSYGRYINVAEIEIDRQTHYLKSGHNNSEAYDEWINPTSKDKRELFLAVLNDEIDSLRELLSEDE